MSDTTVVPGRTVGFVGLGNMGTPMPGHLATAGYLVRGYDADPGVLRVSLWSRQCWMRRPAPSPLC